MRRLSDCLPFVILSFSLSIAEGATPVPSAIVLKLASKDFKERETAESDLLRWVKGQPHSRLKELILQSEIAEDPEIRLRCLSVMRALAMEEYLSEGEGYLGITMQEELVGEPNGPPKFGIRITGIVPKGAAERGTLTVGDLILELEAKGWNQPGAADRFAKRIRETKPGSRISLKIMRNKEPQVFELMLDRRPPIQPNPMGMGQFDLELQDRRAKDAYFKKWLERHQKQK